ncbi:hypothetical protein SETIT_9G452200v2 [Setaria italica]|uniref:Uncharacterized protein n=1 Tax=Setaria italica TaxID=4555 RepID=A0A368SSQ3_SETIT|nr:hypothetical protein SETIT_9G452200v2 [Setaria italica]
MRAAGPLPLPLVDLGGRDRQCRLRGLTGVGGTPRRRRLGGYGSGMALAGSERAEDDGRRGRDTPCGAGPARGESRVSHSRHGPVRPQGGGGVGRSRFGRAVVDDACGGQRPAWA